MSETAQSSPAPEAQAAPAAGALEELQKKLQESEAKYLYLYAEFENYKKRSIKERSDAVKYANEPFAREIVMAIDNLERGLAFVAPGTDQNLVNGLKMVLTQFQTALGQQGIQPVVSLDKPFDPNLHEAVGSEVSDKPSGTVIKEHQKGYTIQGRLLRPARVIVSGGAASTSEV